MQEQTNKLTIKQYLESDSMKTRINELLKDKANQFIVTITAMTAENTKLAECEPKSLVGACLTATAMDLPVNQNLGFVYIIPYKRDLKDAKGKVIGSVNEAQLQFGYKAFIQLAMRSGQFKTISATPVCEGELVAENPLTGFEFDFTKRTSDKVIGYAGYFKLLNGFEKTSYMTVADLTKHGLKYSQTFKRGYGLWKDEFDSMATKTVLKLLLSKYAPMSIDMQQAILADQSVNENQYVDNTPPSLDEVQQEKELQRLSDWIKNANTLDKLKEANEAVYVAGDNELEQQYEEKLAELTAKTVK